MVVRGRTLVLSLIAVMLFSSFFTLFILEKNDYLKYQEDGSTVLPQTSSSSVKNPEKADAELNRFIEAYQKIMSTYVEQKSENDLIDGAISGMVESLNDLHSSYMDAEETESFFGSLSNSFEGIGAEVTMENGRVTVVSPIKGSPSEKAGIQPRDQIINVNGESLEGLNLFEAVNKIRGPKGTNAKLEIIRPGLTDPITISVIRDAIPITTVRHETISTRDGIIGKIEITNFGESTAKEFKTALVELESKEIQGLIIDVRGNPGGYLQSVLDIGNLLIPNNGVILQIEDRNTGIQPYKSALKEPKYPIVAIIDKGSASASEILAAALQEAGNYPIVGETSYGKGTVQSPFELSDGSNLKLTIAKWLTPKGNWIHTKGVQPDIEVAQPEYYKAISFLEDVTLSLDMNNSQVSNLQLILKGLGFDPKRQDGYFDQNTEIAVKAFQKINGLPANGIVEQATAKKLQEKLIERLKDPNSDLQLQVAMETLINLIE